MNKIQLHNSGDQLFVIVDEEYYDKINQFKWQITGTCVKSVQKAITLQRFIWTECMNNAIPPGHAVYHYKDDNRFDYTRKNIMTCRLGSLKYGSREILDWWVQRGMQQS
jgi:hypothetical protein